ncbi:MAG TPA: hypothetical protein DET67_09675 [Ruegeria sp.]|nr:hypothetical protein [Ruegeria sp.]
MKTFALTALIAALPMLAAPAFAADEVNVSNGISAGGAPLAAHGVDLVTLVRDGNPVEGFANYSATIDGASYYFTSEENLKEFQAEPARYLPQHGGFCSYGVAVGKKFDGDPNYAAVVDGKLYVFLNEEIYKMFEKDKAGTISKAAANWTKIEHTAAKDL